MSHERPNRETEGRGEAAETATKEEEGKEVKKLLMIVLFLLIPAIASAGEQFNPDDFRKSLEQAIEQAAKKADEATKPQLDALLERQNEEIAEIWRAVRMLPKR
jgi:hypothetical protein